MTGFNRNLTRGGKRRNKGITKYGKYRSLAERLVAEVKALNDYRKRVGQKCGPKITASQGKKAYPKRVIWSESNQ